MLRKIQPQLFLLQVIIILATGCSSTKPVNLTVTDNGKNIHIKAGEQIFITLDSNPSTGYSWEVKDLDTTILEQVGDPVFQSSNPSLIGSGGTLTITLKALNAGTSTLMLIYHRPWETSAEPIDTFTVLVTVK